MKKRKFPPVHPGVVLSHDFLQANAPLRDLINATIGFNGLGAEIKIRDASLHAMLELQGKPKAEIFFGIVKVLQSKIGVSLGNSASVRIALN